MNSFGLNSLIISLLALLSSLLFKGLRAVGAGRFARAEEFDESFELRSPLELSIPLEVLPADAVGVMTEDTDPSRFELLGTFLAVLLGASLEALDTSLEALGAAREEIGAFARVLGLFCERPAGLRGTATCSGVKAPMTSFLCRSIFAVRCARFFCGWGFAFGLRSICFSSDSSDDEEFSDELGGSSCLGG